MAEIKYTTDGKKVVVIGNLNAQEKIVQEVFVQGEVEIPAGENFVVKSLLDAPAISWKEKHLKDIEENYERRSKDYEVSLERKRRAYEDNVGKLDALNEYLPKVAKNFNPSSLELVFAFLQGKITHIVIKKYSGPEIIKYEDFRIKDNDGYDRNLKLLSLFGRDDGTLTFNIHQYSDGSGHGKEEIYPFTNYEAAFEKFKQILLDERINEEVIKTAKKYKIELDKTKVKEFKKERTENLKKYIKDREKDIAIQESKIEEINNL